MASAPANAGQSLGAVKLQIIHNMTLDPDLKPSAFRVAAFLLIAMVDRDTGRCFISDEKLAELNGISVDNVRRHIKRQAGFLRYFDVRVGKFRGHATEYAITETALRDAGTRKAGALKNMEAAARASGTPDIEIERVSSASGEATPKEKTGKIPANDGEKDGKNSTRNGENSRLSGAKGGKISGTTQCSSSNPDCADGAQEASEKTRRGKADPRLPGEIAGLPDDLLDYFTAAYPRAGKRDAVEEALAGAVNEGADPAHILAAARAYAVEQKGNPPRFIAYPENWLSQERWKQHKPAASPASEDAILANLAGMVTSGKSYAASTISATRARQLLAAGLVTAEQLRAVGVAA